MSTDVENKPLAPEEEVVSEHSRRPNHHDHHHRHRRTRSRSSSSDTNSSSSECSPPPPPPPPIRLRMLFWMLSFLTPSLERVLRTCAGIMKYYLMWSFVYVASAKLTPYMCGVTPADPSENGIRSFVVSLFAAPTIIDSPGCSVVRWVQMISRGAFHTFWITIATYFASTMISPSSGGGDRHRRHGSRLNDSMTFFGRTIPELSRGIPAIERTRQLDKRRQRKCESRRRREMRKQTEELMKLVKEIARNEESSRTAAEPRRENRTRRKSGRTRTSSPRPFFARECTRHDCSECSSRETSSSDEEDDCALRFARVISDIPLSGMVM